MMTRSRQNTLEVKCKESEATSVNPNKHDLDMKREAQKDTTNSADGIDYFRRENKYTDQESFKMLAEIAEEERIKHSSKFKRFGRKEDRGLFNILKNLCGQRSREISEFWAEDQQIDSTLDEILVETLSQIDFKGDKWLLLKRIRKVASNSEFSLREKRLIRRFVEVQAENFKVDFDQISYFFPGKL